MKLFRQYCTLLFALMVFFASSSFTIGLHYCGAEVKGVAFLQHADGCGHKKLPPCHKPLKDNCCSDTMISYEGSGFEYSSAVVNVPSITFSQLALPPVLLSVSLPSSFVQQKYYHNYDPPLLQVDRPAFLSVFLIWYSFPRSIPAPLREINSLQVSFYFFYFRLIWSTILFLIPWI